MKIFSIILLTLINTLLYAQTATPQLINYQGVARNPGGAPVVGQIGLKFELHQGNAGGPVVFTEPHSPTTNQMGIFNVQMGSVNQAQFASIVWGASDYFLEVSIDVLGGTSYVSVGNQQLVSVPYALFAKNAGNSTSYNAGSNITFTGPANNPTINSNPGLSLAGNVLNISGSGSPVTLPTVTLTATPNVTVNVPSLNAIDIKVPNLVAGNNVTITAPSSGNDYTIHAGSSTATATPSSYSLSVNNPHTITAGPFANLNIVAPNLNVTGGGGTVTNNILPNYAINIPTVVITPTTGGLSYSQNGNTATVAIGGTGGPWTTSLNTVNLITTANNVGIGTTNSTAKLTVTTNIAIDAILAQSFGANGILAQSISSGTADAGVYGTNNGGGFGVKGETISTNTMVAGVKGTNTGPGAGVIGENLNSSSASSAHGVKGQTNSSNFLTAGVFGNNSNAGAGLYGINSSATPANSAHGVKGVTNNGGALATGVNGLNTNNGTGVYGEHSNTAPSGNAHGVYGKTNGSSVNAYGVYGENIGGGSGVYGTTAANATNAAGVYGKNTGLTGSGVLGETSATSGAAAAVFGDNLGGTPGVVGQNNSGSNSVLAIGVRGITNSTNGSAVAVSGESTGAAIGVRASIPTATVPGSTNVALQIQEGHIKAMSSISAASTFSTSFTQSATHAIVPNANNNDVRGIVQYTTNQTAPAASSTFININTTFNKIYSTPPVVVITSMNSNLANWDIYLFQVNNSFFSVRAINNGVSASPPGVILFSYIVIE